jgi:hypothetical protein
MSTVPRCALFETYCILEVLLQQIILLWIEQLLWLRWWFWIFGCGRVQLLNNILIIQWASCIASFVGRRIGWLALILLMWSGCIQYLVFIFDYTISLMKIGNITNNIFWVSSTRVFLSSVLMDTRASVIHFLIFLIVNLCYFKLKLTEIRFLECFI